MPWCSRAVQTVQPREAAELREHGCAAVDGPQGDETPQAAYANHEVTGASIDFGKQDFLHRRRN